MQDEPDDLVSPARLRTMQIIAFAQVVGVVIFAAYVVYLVQIQQNGQGLMRPQDLPIFSLLALGMIAVMAVVSYVLPNTILRQSLGRIARGEWRPPPGTELVNLSDADKLISLRQTTMIISLALVEGPAFFGCIAYLMEGRPYVLGAVGAAVLLQLARFPTAGRLRSWLRQQIDLLEHAREAEPPSES